MPAKTKTAKVKKVNAPKKTKKNINNTKSNNSNTNNTKSNNTKSNNANKNTNNKNTNNNNTNNTKTNKPNENKTNVKNNAVKHNTKHDFNNIIRNCVKTKTFHKPVRNQSFRSAFPTEKDYQNSFGEMEALSKVYGDENKQRIDTVIFHKENNDGVFSAYVAWKYITIDNKQPLYLFSAKPSHMKNRVDTIIEKNASKFRGKNILIADLSYSDATLRFLLDIANSVTMIDDHSVTSKNTQAVCKKNNLDCSIYIGNQHAAVAYVWKFFYPNDPVPRIIQYVDDSDRKLYLPFCPYPDLFASAIGFRYSHNKYVAKRLTGDGGGVMEELHQVMKDDDPNFWIFLGKYFEEVQENIKYQVAINAHPAQFQGYNVASINFNAPALTKRVGRQMITNFNKMNRGPPIDFAVLWGYEYTTQGFAIQLVEDHSKPSRVNLPLMAKDLGNIGGHRIGGGGERHIARFSWPKEKGIWTLFEKQYIDKNKYMIR